MLITDKHANFCSFRALAYTTLDRLCAVFLYNGLYCCAITTPWRRRPISLTKISVGSFSQILLKIEHLEPRIVYFISNKFNRNERNIL